MKLHGLVVVVGLAAVLVAAGSRAGAPRAALPVDQEALEGVRGVNVLVEDLQPGSEQLFGRAADIHARVELRLRKAGVRVVDRQTAITDPTMGQLYVNINSMQKA